MKAASEYFYELKVILNIAYIDIRHEDIHKMTKIDTVKCGEDTNGEND